MNCASCRSSPGPSGPRCTLVPPPGAAIPAAAPARLAAEASERFCGAGVDEYLEAAEREGRKFQFKFKCRQINAQNCLHCKACDIIKDPTQNLARRKWPTTTARRQMP